MPDIQAPELSLAILKALNIKGPISVRAVDEVISPVVIVGSLEQSSKSTRVGRAVRSLATVGNQSIVTLTPPTSLTLPKINVVVRWFNVRTSIADRVTVGLRPTGLTPTNVNGVVMDGGSGFGAALIGTQNAGVAANVNAILELGATSQPTNPSQALDGLTLTFGDILAFTTNAQNLDLEVSLVWEEIPVP